MLNKLTWKASNQTVSQRGQTLIEVVVALGVLSAISVVVLGMLVEAEIINLTSRQRVEADLMSDELIERARASREELWQASSDTHYYFSQTEDGWQLTQGEETLGNFTRYLEVENVKRDDQGDISTSGTVDPATLKIISHVSWQYKISRTVNHQTILTRHVSNQAWIQTDWSGGSGQEEWQDESKYASDDERLDPTVQPGTVQLARSGRGGWQSGPKRIASLSTGSKVNDILTIGGEDQLAYLAGEKSDHGLMKVNLDNKENPSLEEVLNIGGRARGVAKSGDYLFLAGGISSQGLVVVDTTTSPLTKVASLDIGGEGREIFLDGNLAYLASSNSSQGLVTVDISNPSSPAKVGQLDIGSKGNDVFVTGQRAYVARDDTSQGLSVVDVSSPSSPGLVTHVTSSGVINRLDGKPSIDQLYAAIENKTEGTRIYDISNQDNPILEHEMNINGEGRAVYEKGDYIYLGINNNDFGLQIIENADKDSPARIGEENVIDSARAVYSLNDYTYLGTDDPDKGFVVVDTLSKMNVATVASIDVWEKVNGLAAREDFAFTTTAHNWSSFMTVDAEDPFDPNVSGFSFIGNPSYQVEVSGDYAFICVDKSEGGLQIANIQWPLLAFRVGVANMNHKANDVATDGDWAFVAADSNNAGFQIIDANTKWWPRVEVQFDIDGKGSGIEIDEHYAYIATENPNEGLVVVNIQNPQSPFKVSGLDIGQAANDVFVAGDYAYLATNSGMRVVDISDPTNPQMVAFYPNSYAVNRVAVSSQFAFLACDDSEFGLVVVDIEDPTNPELANKVKVHGRASDVEVGGDFAAVGIDDPNAGLQIVWNGGGEEEGDRYAQEGQLTSSTFDTGNQAVFNRIEFSGSEPSHTDIKFQLAIKSQEGDPWQWFGPDGTSSSYFNSDKMEIPLDKTEGRYIRYRLFLEGPGTRTPILEEVTINYSF